MADNKFLAVTYKLYTDDSADIPVEEATMNRPFVFISDMGMALDAFEEKIKNLNTGDAFDFIIPCDEAYGMPDQECVMALPKGLFEIDGKFDDERLQIGNFVPMDNSEGQRLIGKVADITDDNVLMDFNHPFAGTDLHFVGIVVESRSATEREKQQALKLISGEGGCGGHCGGHCGGCKDGACDENCHCNK